MFALEVERELITDYVDAGHVRLVHRHMAWGPAAQAAAQATECAGVQGGFWEFRDALSETAYAGGPFSFSSEEMTAIAEGVGLDTGAMEACLARDEFIDHVKEELEAAVALDVHYTPTVYINEARVVGLAAYEVYAEMIESALAAARHGATPTPATPEVIPTPTPG